LIFWDLRTLYHTTHIGCVKLYCGWEKLIKGGMKEAIMAYFKALPLYLLSKTEEETL
jgi:hypothetical protein